MRERQDRLFRLLKKIYSGLQGYLDSDVDVEIQPIKLGFSICFRHDMDRFDERGFDEFMQFEEQFDAPATLFFLESQVSCFGERIRKVTGEKFEMALHSESKPTPFCWSLFQLSRFLERAYARGLRKQAHRFDRSVLPTSGHSAHAVNNYLPFQGWINWNIIENASLRAGFDYISDWRLPSRIAEGEDFLPPWPAYIRQRGKRHILVLPTSWDDKIFFYSYEDVKIRQLAGAEEAYRPRSAQDVWPSFLNQAQRCRDLQTPCIINIHPWHAVCNGQSQFYELKRMIIEWCQRNEIPLLRCRDYLSAIENPYV